jgi:hypothetical protein
LLTLDQLVSQLRAVYGDGLHAVALYGSAARGEHIAKRSDLNVLVIVEHVTMDSLRKEGAVARAWSEAGNPPPLTLTAVEWRGSADIFPIEYADILAHHKVLHGTLPLDGMRVDPAHLRLQLEHEAMSKLLRLRHAILDAAGDERRLVSMLEASLSSMMVLFRATLRLAGEEPPSDSNAVCDAIARRTGIDVTAFKRVVKHARESDKLKGDELSRTVEGYLVGAGRLVGFVDSFR